MPVINSHKASYKRDFDDDEDDLDIEQLKKLSKKMKGMQNDQASDEESEEDDSAEDEDDSDNDEECEDDDDEEDEDDDDEDEDDEDEEESEEDTKMKNIKQDPKKAGTNLKKEIKTSVPPKDKVPKQVKVEPAKKSVETPTKKAPPQPDVYQVEKNNVVVISNIEKTVLPESLKKFISEKSGVKSAECFVSYKPSAVIITENKSEAEKIVESCQSVLYHGSQLQLALCSSGSVARPSMESRKDPLNLQPTTSFIVFALEGHINQKQLAAVCPKAVGLENGKNGIYVSFANENDCKEAFVKLYHLRKIGHTRIFCKYVRNNANQAVHSGNETRLFIFNVPFQATEKDVKELVPKATFIHFNPSAIGSYLVEFANSKDCLEAGSRLHGYQFQTRALKVNYIQNTTYEMRFTAKNVINNAKQHFSNAFPDMIDFHVLSQAHKSNSRKPVFAITLKNRESWLKALKKALELKNVGGVLVSLINSGKMPLTESKPQIKAGEVQGKTDKNVAKKQLEKPKPMSKPKIEQPGSSDEEDDDDDESEEETVPKKTAKKESKMDVDDEDSDEDVDDEDVDDDDDDDEEGDDDDDDEEGDDDDEDDGSEEDEMNHHPKGKAQNGFAKPASQPPKQAFNKFGGQQNKFNGDAQKKFGGGPQNKFGGPNKFGNKTSPGGGNSFGGGQKFGGGNNRFNNQQRGGRGGNQFRGGRGRGGFGGNRGRN